MLWDNKIEGCYVQRKHMYEEVLTVFGFKILYFIILIMAVQEKSWCSSLSRCDRRFKRLLMRARSTQLHLICSLSNCVTAHTSNSITRKSPQLCSNFYLSPYLENVSYIPEILWDVLRKYHPVFDENNFT